MATFIALVFLVTQAQYINSVGRLGGDNNNIDDLGFSDDDYELPKFWDEKFSYMDQMDRPVGRQKKPTTRAPPTTHKKNFQTTKPTTRTTKRTAAKQTQKFDVAKLYFPSLESYAVLASPVAESKYPWIAKVVHSRSEDYPYMCTAVCVEQRIFITAARCVATLKVSITSIIYQNVRFLAKVFVMSDKPTKQLFDDVGLIVVYDNNAKYKGKWPAVKLFDGKRTAENDFKWFDELKYDERTIQHKVIGYTADKRIASRKNPLTEFKLTELAVVVDIGICEELFSKANVVARYHVPCYHYCNRSKALKCTNYHGTEGGAVYNFKTNKLLGLATWGIYSSTSYDLPVGFTVPNSANYYKDLECARKIRGDRNTQPEKAYYQNLCNK